MENKCKNLMSKVVNNSSYHVQRMRKFPEILSYWGPLIFYEVGGLRKKTTFEGCHPKKIKKQGQTGSHVKYFSKTLKRHNFLINEVLELKRKKESRRKGKEK